MTGLRFKEVEHKFVVGADGGHFDLEVFRSRLDALKPARHVTLRVRDRYFITETGRARGFVVRHRFDRELHQLTLKAVVEDAEVREEINLDLAAGDQQAQVDAFVGALGVVWEDSLWKDLEVWHFEDCEVVYYTASAEGRSVRCVEFEAIHKDSLEDALAVLSRYESNAGFGAAKRTPASLLELLWPEVMADFTVVVRRRLDA